MESYHPDIFVSYAWGDEHSEARKLRQAFNNQLFDLLRERKFNLILDKNELRYKDSIRSFMDRIGKGHFIIIILSHKYLTSKYCMYELLKILENDEYKERIFPVVLHDAKIDDPVEKLQYYQYWEEQIGRLNEGLKKVNDMAYIGPVQEELREYAEYKRMILEFTTLTADMISIRVDTLNQFQADQLLDFLEDSVNKFKRGKFQEKVANVTSNYNKKLQRLPEEEKLKRQEFFTREHLRRFNLKLEHLKQMLHLMGYLKSLEKDNQFTTEVADAIASFQSAEGLIPVDGIYGPDAHNALITAAKTLGLLK